MHAPAVRNAIRYFLNSGVFEETDEEFVYNTTEKGRKFVEMICDTPFPIRMYIDPRIDEEQ